MKEYELLNEIKESAENIEVPDDLQPEKIGEELEKVPKRRRPNYIFSLSAAALCIICIGIWYLYPVSENDPLNDTDSISSDGQAFSHDGITNEEAEVSEGAATGISAVAIADDYDTVYEALNEMVDALYGNVASGSVMFRGDQAFDESALLDRSYSKEFTAEVSEDVSVAMDAGNIEPMNEDLSMSSEFSNTNLREEDVDEADIVKTDGQYIYILSNDNAIQIVKAEDGYIENCSEVIISDLDRDVIDFYIDQESLVIISQGWSTDLQETEYNIVSPLTSSYVTVSTFNITDPYEPYMLGEITQEGSYSTSRKVDGILYLFTSFYPEIMTLRDDPSFYIPEVDGKLLPAECIYIPDMAVNPDYITVSSLDTSDPDKFIDSKAVVSGGSQYYVSSQNIYIYNYDWNTMQTQIVKLHFQDGMILAETAGNVKGSVNNSFSIDEYNGYLRVLTTDPEAADNTVHVLNDELETIGKVENLAPGETIYSARFMGDTGYFVTFRNMDPLFSVDFSDPENPIILGELKITGFSDYLQFYGENRLLGIGWEVDPDTGVTEGLKLSMFDISDPSNVTEIDKLVMEDISYSSALYNYKAILANSDKNIIGLSAEKFINRNDYTTKSYYYTFTYDEGDGFALTADYELVSDDDEYFYALEYNSRGIFINNTFYLSTKEYLESYDIHTEDAIDRINLSK